MAANTYVESDWLSTVTPPRRFPARAITPSDPFLSTHISNPFLAPFSKTPPVQGSLNHVLFAPILRSTTSSDSESSSATYYSLASPPRPSRTLFMFSSPSPLAPSRPLAPSPSPLKVSTPSLFFSPFVSANAYTPGTSPIQHSPVQKCGPGTRKPASRLSAVPSFRRMSSSTRNEVPFLDELPRACEPPSSPASLPSFSLLVSSLPTSPSGPVEPSPFSSPLSQCSSPPVIIRSEFTPRPAIPHTRTRNHVFSTVKKRRAPSTLPSPPPAPKKRRAPLPGGLENVQTGSLDAPGLSSGSSSNYIPRTFPADIPQNTAFPLFYRRFPVSDIIEHSGVIPRMRGATYNPPRSPLDLYTPRFVRGAGRTKVGLCPICAAEGHILWLSMKFSAFNYHMLYFHGVSATNALPFSPPIAFRTIARPHATRYERKEMAEGKCHRCKKWVAIEGVKDVDAKVKELYWWKHAASCHAGSTLPGEGDVFIEDKNYAKAVALLEDA
ncbi:hypothetical protein BV25DRAFT_1897100 [Artomyces pyxidatus]|uniref:Uncharacterized protein n=1 Tax=Artomyces pyxidatus TaxID=48021 RepID=A0ACB8TGM8_9AGAM|nr:hypothetical protein BV25DRAFT_1897100 [Artomyces pyxidatus]